MELSDELLEQIGTYLSGQMTAMEKEQFEARMEQDTALRDEVAVHREIKQGLIFMAQKEQFKAMHTDLATRGLLNESEDSLSTDQPMNPAQSSPTNEPPFTRERPRFGAGLSWFAMAASVVLVLGLGWAVYRYQLQTNRYTQAFNTFFSTDLKPIPISDPDRLGAALTDTIANLDSVRLQGAIVSLQRQDMRAALNQLERLTQGAPGHWQASAQWYLALAYLKNRQPDQAQHLMQQIAMVNGHPYQQEAQRFLSQK